MKTEDEIRDYLAEHLDVIEPGLQLYKKELYIPSEIGTRSFIDLVAKKPKRRVGFNRIKAKRGRISRGYPRDSQICGSDQRVSCDP